MNTKESVLRNYKNFFSPWLLWKWSIFFFETSLTFEIIITLFFWGVLFPGLDSHSLSTYIDHIAPIVILTIDYCLNRIPFNLRHLPLSMGLMFIYGIVNMTYTLLSGDPIYKPLTFKNVMSYVWVIVLGGLEGGAYFGLYHLTLWKLKKVQN
jgi:hypothetical protein